MGLNMSICSPILLRGTLNVYTTHVIANKILMRGLFTCQLLQAIDLVHWPSTCRMSNGDFSRATFGALLTRRNVYIKRAN
jgi:hypothetical protein